MEWELLTGATWQSSLVELELLTGATWQSSLVEWELLTGATWQSSLVKWELHTIGSTQVHPIFSVEFLFRLLQWCSISSNFSFLLSNIVRLCVLFLLVIVSSILLWLTTSDYLLGTFRLFLYLHSRVKSFPHHDISLYISYKTIYYQNILLKSFLIWFSWNFQHSYSYKIVTSRIYICA